MKSKHKKPSANGKVAAANGVDSTSKGVPALGVSIHKQENGAAANGEGKSESVPTLSSLLVELEEQATAPHDVFGNPTDGRTALEGIKSIRDIFAKIDEIEKQVVRPREKQRTPEKQMQILRQWLEEKNVQLDGVDFRTNLREGSGVFATKEWKQGELIFTVPESAMMTQMTAMASTKDCSLLISASQMVRELPSLQLALHLLFEKHRPSSDPSPWKGYIESLPGLDDGCILPLGYSVETLEKLEGTQALSDIYRNLRNFANQYVQCRGLFASLASFSPAISRANQWFTYAEWLWAISVVLVRQNNIPHLDKRRQRLSQIMALIPVMDSVNHEPGPATSQYDLGQRHMELTAKRNFKAGEQIYFSYGPRPASLFFLFNGFVPKELTPRDRLRIPVSLSKSDPLYKKKAALLRLVELPTDGLLDLMADGSPAHNLAVWVRVAAMTEEADVVENLRLLIEQKTQELRAEQEEKLKVAANGSATASDPPVSNESEGEKKEANGQPTQSDNTQADGAEETGGPSDEGLQDGFPGEDLEPIEELRPREAAILVSVLEQTLERYPDVQALETAAKSELQSESALAEGVQGLGLGVKDPLAKAKKQELDPRSVIRAKQLATAADILKLERTILERGADRQRKATHGSWETEVEWTLVDEGDATEAPDSQKS